MIETTLKERTKRLLEINEVIKKLDSTIRPAAFLLLQDYVLSETTLVKEKKRDGEQQHTGDDDYAAFFSKHDHDKPVDNALLISAYHFSQYGSSPFLVEEMKSLATKVGVTVPERLDMTYLQAKRLGKSLFLRAGKGAFRPTVHGEAHFKKTYEVSKGTQQKPQTVE